jgi:formamidopyrimidine-DNA glycosylase
VRYADGVPELPDITVYIEALGTRVVGHRLERIRLSSPFVLRTVDPPIDALAGQTVHAVTRVGKRIALAFGSLAEADTPIVVMHLMIAGRLRWRGESVGVEHPAAGDVPRAEKKTKVPRISPKIVLAAFEFGHGTLLFTEAGSKKRASLQIVRGATALRALDPGGVEPLDATLEQFQEALTRQNHTLKRALTDPHLVSGIGNAYSDEILHAARLSPLKLSRSLTALELRGLYDAVQHTLTAWIDRLRRAADGGFPEKVTAFHDAMAVHGRFKQPCPVCGSPVQRIVYAENECNYCATCQTGGRLLADRSLSRLLKDDWPRRLE